MVRATEWGKAFGYGLKFFLVSIVFTGIGAVLIASALSIGISFNDDGHLVISIGASSLFKDLGVLILFMFGVAILVVGNAASFFKLISDIVQDHGKDYAW